MSLPTTCSYDESSICAVSKVKVSLPVTSTYDQCSICALCLRAKCCFLPFLADCIICSRMSPHDTFNQDQDSICALCLGSTYRSLPLIFTINKGSGHLIQEYLPAASTYDQCSTRVSYLVLPTLLHMISVVTAHSFKIHTHVGIHTPSQLTIYSVVHIRKAREKRKRGFVVKKKTQELRELEKIRLIGPF